MRYAREPQWENGIDPKKAMEMAATLLRVRNLPAECRKGIPQAMATVNGHAKNRLFVAQKVSIPQSLNRKSINIIQHIVAAFVKFAISATGVFTVFPL